MGNRGDNQHEKTKIFQILETSGTDCKSLTSNLLRGERSTAEGSASLDGQDGLKQKDHIGNATTRRCSPVGGSVSL